MEGLCIKASKGRVEVYKDDYNEGEQDHVNTWDVDLPNRIYKDFNSLVQAIADTSYCFSEDPKHYVFMGGMLWTSTLVDEDNNIPSEQQLASWQKGELTLYAANFSMALDVCSEPHTMTDEEAEGFGISLY